MLLLYYYYFIFMPLQNMLREIKYPKHPSVTCYLLLKYPKVKWFCGPHTCINLCFTKLLIVDELLFCTVSVTNFSASSIQFSHLCYMFVLFISYSSLCGPSDLFSFVFVWYHCNHFGCNVKFIYLSIISIYLSDLSRAFELPSFYHCTFIRLKTKQLVKGQGNATARATS